MVYCQSNLKSILALIAASFLISACGQHQSKQLTSRNATHFTLRKFDLNQRQSNGLKDWDLSSPEARYNSVAGTVRARLPEGVLYQSGSPAFSLGADFTTVVDNGKLIVLEGSVRLKRLGSSSLLIKGDRLIWRPADSTMVINQRPEAVDRDLKLVADSLTFYLDRNQLIFNGHTQLSRWENSREPTAQPDVIITARDGRWNLKSGTLSAAGPIRADYLSGRRLIASSIQGNIKLGILDLRSPVRFKLESGKGAVNGGRTRWDLTKSKLISKAPVAAYISDGELRGDGFVIDILRDTLIIPRGCRTTQPNKSLRAQRCTWNWKNSILVAEGDINPKHSDSGQSLKAKQIESGVALDRYIRSAPLEQRVQTHIRLRSGDSQDSTIGNRSPMKF
ncbi:LPS export ABC transporter periplasmic protein LptC [Synechococcus sp. M16CYN]|uniref:LPS export ABC transporter periplasmic protein LptC n=1 Tax=Synechococcus sp. M16CYN TaxID=3103139 RepID=UPI0032472111